MAEQIIVNGILTTYTTSGVPKQNGVIVFLHGWGSSKEVWFLAQRHLAECGHVSIALDLPGFGGTALPNAVWSVEDYVKFVEAFLVKLQIKQIYLVGHSFGGRISLVMAATRPEIVKKLILVDSAGIRTYSKLKKGLSLVSFIVKPFFRFRFTNPLRKKIYKLIGAEDYVATPELNKTFVRVIGEDLTHYLPQIVAPTLIVWGEKDIATPVSYAEQFKKEIKNSKLFIFKKAGHYSFIDAPLEFNAELEKFVI